MYAFEPGVNQSGWLAYLSVLTFPFRPLTRRNGGQQGGLTVVEAYAEVTNTV